MAAVSLLSTRGLTRRFGGLTAVDGVDLDLGTGEIRALIGPNGAGKTTLVGLICGRIAPSAFTRPAVSRTGPRLGLRTPGSRRARLPDASCGRIAPWLP